MVHRGWCLRHRDNQVVASLKFSLQPVFGAKLYAFSCKRDSRYAAIC